MRKCPFALTARDSPQIALQALRILFEICCDREKIAGRSAQGRGDTFLMMTMIIIIIKSVKG
jgi:hypothetical protein